VIEAPVAFLPASFRPQKPPTIERSQQVSAALRQLKPECRRRKRVPVTRKEQPSDGGQKPIWRTFILLLNFVTTIFGLLNPNISQLACN
jgi:hypothetical protein